MTGNTNISCVYNTSLPAHTHHKCLRNNTSLLMLYNLIITILSALSAPKEACTYIVNDEQQIISITINISINNDRSFYSITVLKLLFIRTIIPACFVKCTFN